MQSNTPSERPEGRILWSSEMVVIKVGSKAQEFRLHIALLNHYSEYFQGAFRSQLEEGLTRTIALEDVEPPTFEVFADWLYSERLPTVAEWLARIREVKRKYLASHILHLYIFADRFLVKNLKSALVQLLVECLNPNSYPSYKTIILSFDNLSSECPILDLLVDAYCRSCTRSRLDSRKSGLTSFEQLPHDFLRRVVGKFMDAVPRDQTELKAADYIKGTEYGSGVDLNESEDEEPLAKRRRTAA